MAALHICNYLIFNSIPFDWFGFLHTTWFNKGLNFRLQMPSHRGEIALSCYAFNVGVFCTLHGLKWLKFQIHLPSILMSVIIE